MMTPLPDLLYVATFAVAGPVFDYLVFWPAFRHRSQADPARARKWLWAWTIGSAWVLVGAGAALWVASDRSWASLGLSVPVGWRLWTSVALILVLVAYQVHAVATLARSPDARANVRKQMGKFAAVDAIVPHTRTELRWWGGVSVTAGFSEEFLYRGYFVWVFSPWLGWWGAASLSLLFFAIGHSYQGWNGVLRTGVVGAIITLIVAISGSLSAAIALHALLDLGQGMMAWLALREGSARGDVLEGKRPTEPQSASAGYSGPVQPDPAAALDERS